MSTIPSAHTRRSTGSRPRRCGLRIWKTQGRPRWPVERQAAQPISGRRYFSKNFCQLRLGTGQRFSLGKSVNLFWGYWIKERAVEPLFQTSCKDLSKLSFYWHLRLISHPDGNHSLERIGLAFHLGHTKRREGSCACPMLLQLLSGCHLEQSILLSWQ